MKTVVVVDGDHLFYSLRSQVGLKLDYPRLLRFLQATEGDIVRAVYYLSYDPSNSSTASFITLLKESGWEAVPIPLRRLPGTRAPFASRSYDVRMAVDMLIYAETCDKLVLFSGDADFSPVLQALRGKGVTTKVFALPSAASAALRQAAHEFQDLTEIQVMPDLLDDFIGPATEFIRKGFKDPGAALLGVRLEAALRQMCLQRALPVSEADSIDALNNRLASAGAYDRLTKKKIIVWADIRNSATHGLFNKYSLQDVTEMLAWIKSFVGQTGSTT